MPPGFDQFHGLIVPIGLPHHSDDNGDEKAANGAKYLPFEEALLLATGEMFVCLLGSIGCSCEALLEDLMEGSDAILGEK